jgi:hypothetical protein
MLLFIIKQHVYTTFTLAIFQLEEKKKLKLKGQGQAMPFVGWAPAGLDLHYTGIHFLAYFLPPPTFLVYSAGRRPPPCPSKPSLQRLIPSKLPRIPKSIHLLFYDFSTIYCVFLKFGSNV